MYRVCLEKATGKLIEMQSGGDICLDSKTTVEKYQADNLIVLLQNAVNAGFKAEEVEVKFVTEAEWATIKADLDRPTPEQVIEAQIIAEGQKILRGLAVKSLQDQGKLAVDFKG